MRFITGAAMAALLGCPAIAQQAAEPIVVTATLIPTPSDEVASSVTLIGEGDIESHQWRTLPEALTLVPGLSVVQTGGPGGQTSVFIRGANSNHTKVIVDGLEANDPSQNDAFDFGQAVTADIARVEVLRGPQSSLYGSDAIGGVIDVETRAGHGPPKVSAQIEGGSFDTLNESGAVEGSWRRFSYAASVGHLFTGSTLVTPTALLAPGERAIPDRYDNLTASTKLGWDPAAGVRLALVARYTAAFLRTTGEDFADFPAIPDAAQTKQATHDFGVRATAQIDLFHGRFANLFGLGYTDDRTLIQPPDDGFGAAPTLDEGDRVKADWRGTLAVSRTETLVLGAETKRERIIESPVDASDASRAGFVELQSRPMPGFTAAVSVRHDDDDRFGGATTFRVAPAFTIPGLGTILRATYGDGFKAPTLTQLFVSFPSFGFFANPSLRPETSRGYDAGFEQPLAGGRIRMGATYFHNDIRDLIETNATGSSWANIGRATTQGVEAFLAIAPVRRLSVRADYTYTEARDDIAHQALLRRPRNRADLSAQWTPSDRLVFTATALYVGARVDGNRDFSIPRLTASPYAVVNLAGAYRIRPGVTLFARVNNALDRHYQDPTG
ncbi:MAG: TonB-dependent receptor, partial [Caulobacteraceae bacterium]|nr:TonB-dependent receptor [Caulobacteraceae bacterium]